MAATSADVHRRPLTAGQVELLPSNVTSKNAAQAMELALSLARDERLLVAEPLFVAIERALPGCRTKLQQRLVQELESAEVRLYRQRAAEVHDILQDFDSQHDWIFAQKLLGITTSYKRDKSDGSIWLKCSGEMDGVPIFEQLAVVREVALFKTWAPFCNKSRPLHFFGPCELLAWFNINPPFLQRDCVIRVYAVDSTWEDGSIVLIGQSVDDVPGVDIPERPRGLTADRMLVNGFRAKIVVTNPESVQVTLIANVEPRCPVPQSLLNFALKQMVGVLLYFLQKTAKKVAQDPCSAHAAAMRSDPFYRAWMLPKFAAYCEKRGWLLPEIKALGVSPGAHINAAPEPRPSSSFFSMLTGGSKTPRAYAGRQPRWGSQPTRPVDQKLMQNYQSWKKRREKLEISHGGQEHLIAARRPIDYLIDARVGPLLLAAVQVWASLQGEAWAEARARYGVGIEVLLVVALTLVVVWLSWRLAFEGMQRVRHRKLQTFAATRAHATSQATKPGAAVVVAVVALSFAWPNATALLRPPVDPLSADWAGQVSSVARTLFAGMTVAAAVGLMVAQHYVEL